MQALMTAFASAAGEAHETAALQLAQHVIVQIRTNLNLQDGEMKPTASLETSDGTSARFATYVQGFRLEGTDAAVEVDPNGSIKLVNAQLRSCSDDARGALAKPLLDPGQVEAQVLATLSDRAKQVVHNRPGPDAKAVEVIDKILSRDAPYPRYVVRVG
jgi:hypothetical protein